MPVLLDTQLTRVQRVGSLHMLQPHFFIRAATAMPLERERLEAVAIAAATVCSSYHLFAPLVW
jgi:hypothetical protein